MVRIVELAVRECTCTKSPLCLQRCAFAFVLSVLGIVDTVANALALLRVNVDLAVVPVAVCFAFVVLDPNTETPRILPVLVQVRVFAPHPWIGQVRMSLELAVSVGAPLAPLRVADLRLGQRPALLASECGYRGNLTSPNALSGATGLCALGPCTPLLVKYTVHRAGVGVAEASSTDRATCTATESGFADKLSCSVVRHVVVGVVGA